jgi:hypothetical protein
VVVLGPCSPGLGMGQGFGLTDDFALAPAFAGEQVLGRTWWSLWRAFEGREQHGKES